MRVQLSDDYRVTQGYLQGQGTFMTVKFAHLQAHDRKTLLSPAEAKADPSGQGRVTASAGSPISRLDFCSFGKTTTGGGRRLTLRDIHILSVRRSSKNKAKLQR